MKNYFLLIAFFSLVFFNPVSVFADDHHWYSKFKDFLSSNFPSNPKYCASYDGSIYIVGSIFKSKTCRKGDREFNLSVGSGTPGSQGPQGIQGLAGIDGLPGAKGDKGDTGASGASLSGYEIVTSEISLDDNLAKDITATCSAGKKVISGGFNSLNVSDSGEVAIKASFPNTDASWRVMGSVDAGTATTTYSLQAYAICAIFP